jgi:hypothetical protein
MPKRTLWLALVGAISTAGCWHSGDIGGERDTDDDTESESGTDTGPDVDTDTDTDADTDIESDSDTDPDTGWAMPCGGQPEDCTDIGPTLAQQEAGCCHGSTLYWCIECVEDEDGGQDGLCIEGQKWLKSFDCEDVDGNCGIAGEDDDFATCVEIDDDSTYSCGVFTKFCEDIGDTLEIQQFGCCLVGFRFDCWEAGYVHFEDCVGTGSMCGYDSAADQIDCIGE